MKTNGIAASKLITVAIAIAFSALAAQAVQAHDSPARESPQFQQVDQLGRLSFPTSAKNPLAQSTFVEGMLLLHVFEYQRAQLAFQKAQLFRCLPNVMGVSSAASATERVMGPIWSNDDANATKP